MKTDVKLKQLLVGISVWVLTSVSYASEQVADFNLPASPYFTSEVKSFVLAENEVSAPKAKSNTAAVAPAAEFDPPLLSGSNTHKYLGLATIGLAGLTMVTAPGEGCEKNCAPNVPRDVNGPHAQLAKATVAMAAATIVSGLITHWDDFSLEDGWTDPDNLHILLGVAGAGVMAYAVQKSAAVTTGTVSHAGMAELGALGMIAAIKLTW